MYVPTLTQLLAYARRNNAGREVYLYLVVCSINTMLIKTSRLRRRVLSTLGSLFNEAMLENLDRLLPLNWRLHARYQRIMLQIKPSKPIEEEIEKFDGDLRSLSNSIFLDRCKKFSENLILLPLASDQITRKLFLELPALRSKYFFELPSDQERELRKLEFKINFITQCTSMTTFSSMAKLHSLANQKIFGLVTVNVEKYVATLLQAVLPQNNEVILILRDWQDASYAKLRRTLQRSKYFCNFTHSDELLPFPCEVFYLK